MVLLSIPSRGTAWKETLHHGMVKYQTLCLQCQTQARDTGVLPVNWKLVVSLGKMAKHVSGSQMAAPLAAQNVMAKPGVPAFTLTKWTPVVSILRQLSVTLPKEQ